MAAEWPIIATATVETPPLPFGMHAGTFAGTALRMARALADVVGATTSHNTLHTMIGQGPEAVANYRNSVEV